MATIREVLYQHTKKNSSRSIARAFNMSNRPGTKDYARNAELNKVPNT